jgi:hypothetical protein
MNTQLNQELKQVLAAQADHYKFIDPDYSQEEKN